MKVETSKLARGLSDSAAMVRNFQRSASADFGGASRLMASGLKNVSDGFQGIGIVAAGATKGAATFVRNWVDAAHYIYGKGFTDPLVAAAKASADALIYTYGGLGKKIGGVLSKAGGPLGAAAKASFASLDYVYGPAIKAIGSGLATAASVAARALMPLAASVGTVAVGLGKMALGAGQAAIGLGKLAAAGAIKGMQGLGAATMRMVATVREGINVLGRFAGVAALVGGYGLVKVAKAASDVTEAMNLAKIEFGASSGVIIAEANRLSDAFGVSKKETIGAASAFAGSFKEAGFNAQQSADMAVQFLRRMKDLESAKNLAPGAAFEKLQSALAGEIKPLRDIGYAIDDNMVKQQAYAMGIAKVGEELTQQQKFQARIPLILGKTANVEKDMALTATEVAGAWRTVAGRVESLAETIGTALEPVTRSVLNEMGTGLAALQLAWKDNQAAIISWASGLVGGAAQGAGSMGILQQSVGFVADAFQVLSIGFSGFQSLLTKGLSVAVGYLQTFNEGLAWLIRNVSAGFADVKANDFFKTWSEDLARLSVEQDKVFQTKLAAPPASAGVNAYFDKARVNVEALRSEAAKLPSNKPAIVGAGLAAPGKLGKEVKFASAAALGSQEATNAILRSRFGRGGKATADEAKKTANNTAKANEYLSKIATAVSTQAAGVLVPI